MAEELIFCSRCGAQNGAGASFCQRCGASLNPVGIPVGPAPAAPAYASAVDRAAYGGFWIRVLAAIIDYAVLSAVLYPVIITFAGFRDWRTFHGEWDSGELLHFALVASTAKFFSVTASWLYEALMLSSSWQGTLGKKALGLRVTDEYGQRITFLRATGRHFAKYLSWMTLCIGFLMVAFTERRQALHDFIAGTLVRRNSQY